MTRTDLTPAMIETLRRIAAQPASEPTLWGLNRATVRALAVRGLVAAEAASYGGHFGRFGQSVSANRARLTFHSECGARLTDAGRAALIAH